MKAWEEPRKVWEELGRSLGAIWGEPGRSLGGNSECTHSNRTTIADY